MTVPSSSAVAAAPRRRASATGWYADLSLYHVGQSIESSVQTLYRIDLTTRSFAKLDEILLPKDEDAPMSMAVHREVGVIACLALDDS
jgi:hypothetical protein